MTNTTLASAALFLWGVFAHPAEPFAIPQPGVAQTTVAGIPLERGARKDPRVQFEITGSGWSLAGIVRWSFLQSILHARFAAGESITIQHLEWVKDK